MRYWFSPPKNSMISTTAKRIAVAIMKIETKKPRGDEMVDLPLTVKLGIGL